MKHLHTIPTQRSPLLSVLSALLVSRPTLSQTYGNIHSVPSWTLQLIQINPRHWRPRVPCTMVAEHQWESFTVRRRPRNNLVNLEAEESLQKQGSLHERLVPTPILLQLSFSPLWLDLQASHQILLRQLMVCTWCCIVYSYMRQLERSSQHLSQ